MLLVWNRIIMPVSTSIVLERLQRTATFGKLWHARLC